MKLKNLISEAPLADIQHFGDMERNSSFRDPKDRKLIQNKAVVHKLKQAFDRVDVDVYLYFVNSPRANHHTEVGDVSLDWVHDNLDLEVSQALDNNINRLEDQIHIIFTNNKGAERKVMTPWIIAHRIGHVFARGNGGAGNRTASYQNLVDVTSAMAKEVLEEAYGIGNIVSFDDGFSWDSNRRQIARNQQLAFKSLYSKLCTFASARNNKIRDYFEVWNELIAQYLITGKIEFNPLPEFIWVNGVKRFIRIRGEEREELNNYVQMYARDLTNYILPDLFGDTVGKIFLM
tara:strand:- start:49 stop:918 length:870 start_codon:yes stop_codon:yes gene_type:complete